MKDQRLPRSYIHESNLIEGFDSKEADDALATAWTLLRNSGRGRAITSKTLLHVHELAVSHQDIPDIWRGRYRSQVSTSKTGTSGRVTINGVEAPNPAVVTRMMEDWLDQYGDVNREFSPIIAHIAFEKIHPFMDGNGRVGRLLLWWHEKSKGLPYTKFTYDTRDTYYKWFE